ncbi:MAG: response regulator [Chryseosolibacter sp.]
MSILYVDDDIEDIEIFQDAVDSVDRTIQYRAAQSGKELFEILNTLTVLPDHVILDINMPGMDGRLCLQEIRKHEKYNRINVIVYSTNSFPKDIEHIESLGATFIRKANSFNDLCAIVRKLSAWK